MENQATILRNFKIFAVVGIMVSIILLILWFKMIGASYADDNHDCKSKLWARYVGYMLVLYAFISLCKNTYVLYALLR